MGCGRMLLRNAETAKRALHARCTLHLLYNATFWFIETMIVAVYETPRNTNKNEGFDYVDGALSREYLLSRGRCCENGCRNCPWRKSDG